VAGRAPQNGFPRFGIDGDNGPAVGALLNSPGRLALGPSGSLFVADPGNARVRRVMGEFPTPGTTRYVLPSADGGEAYVFDARGRHVETAEALTGGTLYTFAYDAAGRLVEVHDGDGNVTLIERAGDGAPLAIVGPYGQRTALTADANGYLTSLTTPAGEVHHLVHGADGLLTSRLDPRGGEYRFTYEPATGRLTRAEDPAGGSTTLARAESAAGYQVTRTDAPGRVTTYGVERQPGGGQRLVNGLPDGTRIEAVLRPNGTTEVTRPDGTVATVRVGPDPRWGMLVPLIASLDVSLPGGATTSLTNTRTVSLADALDPLSVVTLRDTLTVNGRAATSTFDAASSTITATTAEGRRDVFELDAQGRDRRVGLAGLFPIDFGRDGDGRLVSASQGSGAAARLATAAYGAHGRPA
jgi:YD repeat-containing protein